jgi:hypothetical protein
MGVKLKNPNAPATRGPGQQVPTIVSLLDTRVISEGFRTRCFAKINDGSLTMKEASDAISYLLKQPKRPDAQPYRPRPAAANRGDAYRQQRSQGYVNAATVSNPTMQGEIKVKPGVFERPDGNIYVVKPNRQGSRLYAKRMIQISAERLNLLGNEVKFEFEYDKGAIFGLDESMRLPEDRVQELCLKYGRCIMCNRPLKAAQSVKRMIGPVCYGRIQGMA